MNDVSDAELDELLRRAFDGGENAVIGSAAADISIHVFDDLLPGRLRRLRKQFRRRHDLSGLAVPALRHLLLDPGHLQRVVAVVGETLDGRDASSLDRGDGELAGLRRVTIDMHGAGAALADAAAELGAGQPKVLAEHPEQGRIGIDIHLFALSIDPEGIACHNIKRLTR